MISTVDHYFLLFVMLDRIHLRKDDGNFVKFTISLETTADNLVANPGTELMKFLLSRLIISMIIFYHMNKRFQFIFIWIF